MGEIKMKKEIYGILKNDKVKYMLVNWNKAQLTVQNKCQVLKELVDVTADYIFNLNGKDYSKEENKYAIFTTSEKYYPIDKENLSGKDIVVFHEDLVEKKDHFGLLNDFVLKIYDAIDQDMVIDNNKAHVLREMELNKFSKIQLEASKEIIEKKR